MKKFKVTGMSCAACSARVERAVGSLDGVDSCSVNLLSHSMTVEGVASAEEIISAVNKAGYGAEIEEKIEQKDKNSLQKSEEKAILRQIIASVCILIPLVYISMGYVMWGAPVPSFIAENHCVTALIEFVLCLCVLLINRRFFIRGARAVLSGSPNMDTLVSLGASASFVYSAAITVIMIFEAGQHNTAHYLHELYFESAAMIVTLISVGKMLEERAKGKTTDALSSLLSLSPRMARVIRSGEEISISADEVEVGDVFVLRPGDSVPVDGVVIKGESSIYEAALTGESIPSDKAVGSKVMAATVNGSGYLECRAERVREDTVIAEVIRLVSDASSSKAPISKAADRISAIFVPSVLVISLLSFILWLIFGAEVGYALGRAISVLVISCPCALGLATPVAIMVGVGVGARRGILYKNAEAIEAIGRARVVAFDKTGTLTEGRAAVSDVISLGASLEDIISTAAALEEKSEHPLARAVVRYAEENSIPKRVCESFESTSGAGVLGVIMGEVCRVGKSEHALGGRPLTDSESDVYKRLATDGKTPVFVTRGDAVLGVIGIADKIRPEARELVGEIKKMGLRVVMLTGDNSYTGRAVGSEIGIDEVLSSLLPQDKEREIRRLGERGGVIMVGDGINDAPSLMLADAGIAVGGGTDIAIESANVVLMRQGLSEVLHAIRLGRATLKNIYENLFWAFIYNVIGIPLAAGAFAVTLGIELSPMLGALAMSLSSFSVVMNALRLNFYGQRRKKSKNSRGLGIDNFENSSWRGEDNCENPHSLALEECEKSSSLDGEKSDSKKIENDEDEMKGKTNVTVKLNIEGMMCPHCEARVKSALSSVEGAISVEVSHINKEATVVSESDISDMLSSAVTDAGYNVISIEKM